MTGTTITPTDEQQTALALFATGKSLAIEAGAGAGKTSTLKLLAQSTSRRGQYVAFNKAIVEEAKAKMPSNVNAATAHALAFRNVASRNRWMPDRLKGSARMKSTEIANRLRIEPITVTLPDGTRKRLAASFLAGLTMRAVTKFCQSDEQEPGAHHVPKVEGIDIPPTRYGGPNNQLVARALVPAMRKAWADLVSPDCGLPFKHDHYLKMWHLSGPRIDAEFILFDEAQDANPVLVDIVRQQTHAQLVWVGDSNQQIYSFTGAVNALQTVGAEQQAFLSQSFRFGPAIADAANYCLARLDAKLRLTGTDTIASSIGTVEEPGCILSRTNATAVRGLLNAIKAGRRPHLVGGGREVVDFAKAAQSLQRDGWTSHPELACFESWGEVQSYVEQDEQGGDLKLLVDLIEEFGVETIIGALENMPREENADVVLSTAHKAKGREWDTVQLADDFPADATGEELRLLYVAITRAKLTLDLDAMPLLAAEVTDELEEPFPGYDANVRAGLPADWDGGDDGETRTATEAEAHLEWHRNAGVPVGQPCPWDACDPGDEPHEETTLAPFAGVALPTDDGARAAFIAGLSTEPAAPHGPGTMEWEIGETAMHLWADGMFLGEHFQGTTGPDGQLVTRQTVIEKAQRLYGTGRFNVVTVYTANGELVIQLDA